MGRKRKYCEYCGNELGEGEIELHDECLIRMHKKLQPKKESECEIDVFCDPIFGDRPIIRKKGE